MDSLQQASLGRQLQPIDTVTASDLTQAAATVLCTFAFPPDGSLVRSNVFQSGVEILGLQQFSNQLQVAGSTQGIVALFINGVETTVAPAAGTSNWSRITNGATTAKGATKLALVESAFAPLSELIVYPTITKNDLVEVRIQTQGVGGTQTAFFQLLVRGRIIPADSSH